MTSIKKKNCFQWFTRIALFKNKYNQFEYVEENAKTAFRTSGKTKDSSSLLLGIIALISIQNTHWNHYYFLQWRLLEKLVGEKILILIVIVSIQWAYILNITYCSHMYVKLKMQKHLKRLENEIRFEIATWNLRRWYTTRKGSFSLWSCWLATSRIVAWYLPVSIYMC